MPPLYGGLHCFIASQRHHHVELYSQFFKVLFALLRRCRLPAPLEKDRRCRLPGDTAPSPAKGCPGGAITTSSSSAIAMASSDLSLALAPIKPRWTSRSETSAAICSELDTLRPMSTSGCWLWNSPISGGRIYSQTVLAPSSR